MIVTLTPNPSIDRTVATGRLVTGEVNRASSTRIDPGGKGVNVSRALHRNGHATLAVLPLGGPDGQSHRRLLDDAAVPYVAVPCNGDTRTNIAIVDKDGTTTKINEPGPHLDAEVLDALVDAVPTDADWVVLCGSLPAGASPEWLAGVVAAVPGRVVVDTSGAPLAAAVGRGPHLIKPNREELEELVGQPLCTVGDVVEAAHGLIADGVGVVVASLGSDGALWVSDAGVWLASATVERPLSSVGAGDCLLAGLLAALDDGAPPAVALSQGVTWGAAAVSLPGSVVPGPDDVSGRSVACINNPDPATPLNA